jgi:hypothetical protein
MGAKLGADIGRPITASGTAAHQRFGKTPVVLPARGSQLVDGCLRVCRLDATNDQLACEFQAGVLAPGQQAEGPLGR